jgi:hypothetical protein
MGAPEGRDPLNEADFIWRPREAWTPDDEPNGNENGPGWGAPGPW